MDARIDGETFIFTHFNFIEIIVLILKINFIKKKSLHQFDHPIKVTIKYIKIV